MKRGEGRIEKILRLLEKAYGRPARFRRTDPVDQLIATILSQNTSDVNSLKAFRVLKKRFRPWNALLEAGPRRIARLIRKTGLALIKSERMIAALAEIKRREGRIDVSSVGRLDIKSSLEYLRSLKGVGPKTAACVLLFSFAKPVMPVDTHIFRVSRRLGLMAQDTDIEEAHRVLTELVSESAHPGRRRDAGAVRSAKDLIYRFHLGIIEHGRKTCKAVNPGCGRCVLYGLCRFEDKAEYRKRGRL